MSLVCLFPEFPYLLFSALVYMSVITENLIMLFELFLKSRCMILVILQLAIFTVIITYLEYLSILISEVGVHFLNCCIIFCRMTML